MSRAEIPIVQPISAAPIVRPVYVNTPETLIREAAWLRVNLPAVQAYYSQLARAARYEGDFDGDSGVSLSEFASVQYDCAVAQDRDLRDRVRIEQQDELRYRSWEDRAADDAGVRRWGEL